MSRSVPQEAGRVVDFFARDIKFSPFVQCFHRTINQDAYPAISLKFTIVIWPMIVNFSMFCRLVSKADVRSQAPNLNRSQGSNSSKKKYMRDYWYTNRHHSGA